MRKKRGVPKNEESGPPTPFTYSLQFASLLLFFASICQNKGEIRIKCLKSKRDMILVAIHAIRPEFSSLSFSKLLHDPSPYITISLLSNATFSLQQNSIVNLYNFYTPDSVLTAPAISIPFPFPFPVSVSEIKPDFCPSMSGSLFFE
jgi:hypothetical protein